MELLFGEVKPFAVCLIYRPFEIFHIYLPAIAARPTEHPIFILSFAPSRLFLLLRVMLRPWNDKIFVRISGQSSDDFEILQFHSDENNDSQKPHGAGSRFDEVRGCLFWDYLSVSIMINELNCVDVVGQSLSGETCPVGASSKSSANVHLDHDHIGLVLVSVLDAPHPQLVVTHPRSNFHQMLLHLPALFCHFHLSDLPDKAQMLNVSIS
jgi:hypothetical protein